jgi:hypothetical protein
VEEALGWVADAEPVDERRGGESIQRAQAGGHAALIWAGGHRWRAGR